MTDNPMDIAMAQKQDIADKRAAAAKELLWAMKLVTNDLAVAIEKSGADPALDARVRWARNAIIDFEALL